MSVLLREVSLSIKAEVMLVAARERVEEMPAMFARTAAVFWAGVPVTTMVGTAPPAEGVAGPAAGWVTVLVPVTAVTLVVAVSRAAGEG